MDFQKAVLSYTTDKGIKPKDFGSKAQVNRVQFNKYMNGTNKPGINTINKIVEVFPDFAEYLNKPTSDSIVATLRAEIAELKKIQQIQNEQHAKLIEQNSKEFAELKSLITNKILKKL